jgi:RNA polymerase sigma factor (sigma-70 family)
VTLSRPVSFGGATAFSPPAGPDCRWVRHGAAEDELVRLGESFDNVMAAAFIGAPWALERLWRELAPVVSGYLRAQGAAEPEDMTSDVFLNVFSRLGSFRGDEDQLRAWVFTIAHHRLVDERRRQARRPLMADLPLDRLGQRSGGDVEADAARRMSDERVHAMCAALPPDQRDVLLLRMAADLTLAQTADALGKSPGAVKALQHRAVAALRRYLDQEVVSR